MIIRHLNGHIIKWHSDGLVYTICGRSYSASMSNDGGKLTCEECMVELVKLKLIGLEKVNASPNILSISQYSGGRNYNVKNCTNSAE